MYGKSSRSVPCAWFCSISIVALKSPSPSSTCPITLEVVAVNNVYNTLN